VGSSHLMIDLVVLASYAVMMQQIPEVVLQQGTAFKNQEESGNVYFWNSYSKHYGIILKDSDGNRKWGGKDTLELYFDGYQIATWTPESRVAKPGKDAERTGSLSLGERINEVSQYMGIPQAIAQSLPRRMNYRRS
jgi:hypothetical protein